MQGIHDLGGMDGFTLPERDQGRVLAEEWEREVWGLLFSLSVPGISIGGRLAIEAIPPALYLNMPYYARWLYIQEQAVLASGLVTAEELANPEGPITIPDIPSFEPARPEEVLAFVQQDASAELDLDVPALFSVGDAVVVTNDEPVGHTRVPRYVRGRGGVVVDDHGVHTFEDAIPAGETLRPQHLYTVRFAGSELWGSQGHANDFIHVDLWDDHLEPAN
jgi:nitrile hydratase beta subunit